MVGVSLHYISVGALVTYNTLLVCGCYDVLIIYVDVGFYCYC